MLHVNDITFRFGERVLLDQATVAIPDGAKVGLTHVIGLGSACAVHVLEKATV